jgi:hypothetical protein
MKNCLVCLVGDQTVPNITVAVHFEPEFLLLISTSSMERKGKTRAILETLKLRGLDYSDKHHKIEVLEDSIMDLQAKVSRWLDGAMEEYHFIVNLTGGTKLMAIAAYDLFTDFDSEMIYVAIGKNEYLTPFPKRRPGKPSLLDERLTVKEYFSACGVRIDNQGKLEENKARAEARREITYFLFNHYEEVRPLLKSLGAQLRLLDPKKDLKKGFEFTSLFTITAEVQAELLKRLGFEYDGSVVKKKIDKSEWEYLRGGWLEERIFLAVKEGAPSGADIHLNVKIKDTKEIENELDVVFTHENTLYIIECKSLDAAEGGEQHMGGTVTDFLYKLGALRQNFGLTPRGYLATTDRKILYKNGEVKSHITERGKQFGIRILSLLKVQDLEKFIAGELFQKG